ncbi:MAG: hypothetical protein ACXVCM_26505, partial [Ktedonobacteraceae bacterium]
MNSSSASTQVTPGQKRLSEVDTRLYGPWLIFARIIWIVLVVLSLTISLIDIPLQFARLHIVCVGSDCAQQLTLSILRDLHKLNISVDFFAASVIILEFGFYFVWVVVAFVIFWRKSNDWMALLVALFLVLFPATQSLGSPGDVGTAFPSLHVVTSILDGLGWFMLLLFFFLFPDGRFIPRWTAWGALGYVLVNIIGDLFPNLPSNGVISFFFGLPLLALIVGIGLFSQIYRYIRISNPIQRQQTKWVLFGVIAAVVLFIVLVSPLIPVPKAIRGTVFGVLIDNTLFHCVVLLIPLSIGFSILRYRLYDIDLLINRTLVYGTLTLLLALIYLVVCLCSKISCVVLQGRWGNHRLSLLAQHWRLQLFSNHYVDASSGSSIGAFTVKSMMRRERLPPSVLPCAMRWN